MWTSRSFRSSKTWISATILSLIKVWKASPRLKSLRRLLLRDALVTDDGLKSIAGLSDLEELDLSGVRITDKGIEYLRNLKAMRRLNLLGVQATDASMDVVAGMAHLEVLNLYRTKVTNTGLAKLQNLKGLVDLDLRYSRVTSNGLVSTAGRAAEREASVRRSQPTDIEGACGRAAIIGFRRRDRRVAQILGRHDSVNRMDT